MKRIIALVVLGVVALWAGATDRFYIEDFTINPGETRTVEILLDNETAYTAFQCDLYLPDGLTVEQEDGDYIFDLTPRKARDHSIASQPQSSGAIRVISYSPHINAYSGNSGALVTFSVTASADFEGPATIRLRNVLFTTLAGTEESFADETCTVTTAHPWAKGDVNHNGFIDINDVTLLIAQVLGTNPGICLTCADIYEDNQVDINDVTSLINKVLGVR